MAVPPQCPSCGAPSLGERVCVHCKCAIPDQPDPNKATTEINVNISGPSTRAEGPALLPSQMRAADRASRPPWYHQAIWVWIIAILLWPVGAFMMWNMPTWTAQEKRNWIILSLVIWGILMAIGAATPSPR